jgi:hypothetical protein
VLEVDIVDPDPAVAHHHLARRGNRVGSLGYLQLFRAAVAGDLDREH